MIRASILAAVAAPALAFSPMAGVPALRGPTAAVAPSVRSGPSVGLRMSSNPEEGKVMFDSISGWVPEHHKQTADQTGNVDVGDYFDDPSQAQGAGDTGFQSGAAATGGTGGNKLASLLSASNTEVRAVEKESYGPVEFTPHPWRIDGDYNADPNFDLSYNSAQGCAETEICLEPNSMTFEDFVAGFSPDSAPNWEVTPTSGTLQRRGGEPQWFDVKFKGAATQSGENLANLVIVLPGDNFSYTYKLRCKL